ncbi:hypothetical protein BJX64DRAFT_251997 [Aspergillus heterothallicus]
MAALEEEVTHLRADKEGLAETAADWQRCVSAIIGPTVGGPGKYHEILRFGPGFFLWPDSSARLTHPTALGNEINWQLLQFAMPTHIYPTLNPSPFALYSNLEYALLHNFCQQVVPSLEVTRAATDGYIKHIVPLALNSEMVMSSLLAASAIHIQVERTSNPTVCALKYRSTAVVNLRQASLRPHANSDARDTIFALSTILGLFIEDIISGNKEFPMLLKLATFWMSSNACSDPDAIAVHCFLTEQINLLKRLVYPVYQFEIQQMKAAGSLVSNDPTSTCRVFTLIQSAVTQACTLYTLSFTDSGQESSLSEINILLDGIKSTASQVPEYALGENSLVWVYSTAMSKSTQPDHQAFFTSRLAELLRRLGYDDIREALSSTHS